MPKIATRQMLRHGCELAKQSAGRGWNRLLCFLSRFYSHLSAALVLSSIGLDRHYDLRPLPQAIQWLKAAPTTIPVAKIPIIDRNPRPNVEAAGCGGAKTS